ncbi:sigma-70 family RNA polymerase sigma factor [Pararhizobium haloflavum]|uniref:sigma-70 family RNA polymerase sigma factor n=1 Tax=Pararhizobium haloflavum TaxID=2037914 RepID=UPI000C187AC6|nr:sigma-70 family RNA polymerase sigma factor [Pararhizobium haloflavum]
MLDHAEALSRCANGDRAALKALFEAEAGRLIAVAERILRRRDVAEEVVQDAFIQIWRKADQYSADRGSARGWIYAVVRNRALNVLRDGRREDLADEADLTRLSETANLHDDRVLDRLDATSRLRQCLQQLDEAKRRSLLMAYMSGYTHGEIAGRMNVPLGTAKAWVRRGLSALRECMG